MSDGKQISTSTAENIEDSTQSATGTNTGTSTTKGYSGLTLTQLHRIFAEQMVVANEVIFYNFEKLFNQIVI